MRFFAGLILTVLLASVSAHPQGSNLLARADPADGTTDAAGEALSGDAASASGSSKKIHTKDLPKTSKECPKTPNYPDAHKYTSNQIKAAILTAAGYEAKNKKAGTSTQSSLRPVRH